MRTLATQQPLTAGAFSHSVHNTAAGLLSIASGNTAASSSTAARHGTFCSAMIEAIGVLNRTRATRVLMVVGDVPVPAPLNVFTSEPEAPYGLALILSSTGDGQRVSMSTGGLTPPRAPWPDALQFLRWLSSSERSIAVGAGRNRLTFNRED